MVIKAKATKEEKTAAPNAAQESKGMSDASYQEFLAWKEYQAQKNNPVGTPAQKQALQEVKETIQVDPATAAANRSKLSLEHARARQRTVPSQTPGMSYHLSKQTKMNGGRQVYEAPANKNSEKQTKNEFGLKQAKDGSWFKFGSPVEITKGLQAKAYLKYEDPAGDSPLEPAISLSTGWGLGHSILITIEQLSAITQIDDEALQEILSN